MNEECENGPLSGPASVVVAANYITYLSNREELLFHSVFSSLGLVSSPAGVPPEGFDMVRRFDQSG